MNSIFHTPYKMPYLRTLILDEKTKIEHDDLAVYFINGEKKYCLTMDYISVLKTFKGFNEKAGSIISESAKGGTFENGDYFRDFTYDFVCGYEILEEEDILVISDSISDKSVRLYSEYVCSKCDIKENSSTSCINENCNCCCHGLVKCGNDKCKCATNKYGFDEDEIKISISTSIEKKHLVNKNVHISCFSNKECNSVILEKSERDRLIYINMLPECVFIGSSEMEFSRVFVQIRIPKHKDALFGEILAVIAKYIIVPSDCQHVFLEAISSYKKMSGSKSQLPDSALEIFSLTWGS